MKKKLTDKFEEGQLQAPPERNAVNTGRLSNSNKCQIIFSDKDQRPLPLKKRKISTAQDATGQDVHLKERSNEHIASFQGKTIKTGKYSRYS